MPSPSRRPPHVVMISGCAPPLLDGVGDYTDTLLEELARRRPEWRWTWLSRRARWFLPPVTSRGAVSLVRPVHSWRGRFVPLAGVALKALRPDLVHIQEQIHSYFESDAAVRLAEATDRPVITTVHEYHSELPSVVHTTRLVRRSNFVIANDAAKAERCEAESGRAPDARWWTGRSVEPADPSWGVRSIPGRVTTFGFMNGLKAIPLLGEALATLKETHSGPLEWRIVGPFEPAANPLHAEIAARVSRPWVEFTGGFPVRDRALRSLLAESSVMALPFVDGASTRRGTLQTAWAFGLPVVTTPPSAPEPDIVDGENCLLVREPTPAAWAEAVRTALTDEPLRARLRAGALRAAEKFGWAELARRHLELYDALRENRVPDFSGGRS